MVVTWIVHITMDDCNIRIHLHEPSWFIDESIIEIDLLLLMGCELVQYGNWLMITTHHYGSDSENESLSQR